MTEKVQTEKRRHREGRRTLTTMTPSVVIGSTVVALLVLGSVILFITVPSELISALKSETVRCPPPFFYFKSECFYFYLHEAKTWSDARAVCKSMGGDLAEPKDLEAFFSLKREIAGDVSIIWLGVFEEALEGEWMGLSGKRYPMKAIPWSPGEPNNADGNERYLNILEHGYNDEGATKEKNFACECQLN